MAKNINYAQVFARKETIRKQWLRLNPTLNNESGIYVLIREENGFKFGYVGQAIHILDRLISHSEGFDQHIDRSLKTHKLYDETKNPNGYKVLFKNFPQEKLDEMEKEYTLYYANNGVQLRNKTSGSQGKGKFAISENKSSKGYYDGVAYGEKKAKKKVKEFFDKYLDYQIKEPKNKIKERKLGEFAEFLKENNESGD